MSESQRVFSSTAPPPLRQGHPEACRGRGRGWRRGKVGATESPPEGKSWERDKAPPSTVSLLFLESPSSRQLLGEWQYFHLTDTQEETEVVHLLSRTFRGKRAEERRKRDCDEEGEQSEAGGLPKEEEAVFSKRESAEMVGRVVKDVWQLGGEVAAGQEPILPSYQQLCSTRETLLHNSPEEFLTAPSSLAVGSSLVAQDEDFYSASSSLEMDIGRPQIVIDSATDSTEEEEEEEGISEESDRWSRREEDKFFLATPTYVGRRQLELEEGSVSLRIYSEGGLAGWEAGGRWGGQLASVDILGLVTFFVNFQQELL